MADSFHVQRFNRSAERYERAAAVQARMAENLLELTEGLQPPGKILELGCGTGLLTRRIQARFPKAAMLATDAAPRMLDLARRQIGDVETNSSIQFELQVRFELQDVEGDSDPVPAVAEQAPFDWIASNALVQWFPRLAQHLRWVARCAASEGIYLVSGFLRSNFPELNSLLAEPPFAYRNFPGHDPEDLRNAAEATGWRLMSFHAWEEQEIAADPISVLHRMRALGSTRDPRLGGKLNRRNLEGLLSTYRERYAEADGVALTWRPWVALLRLA